MKPNLMCHLFHVPPLKATKMNLPVKSWIHRKEEDLRVALFSRRESTSRIQAHNKLHIQCSCPRDHDNNQQSGRQPGNSRQQQSKNLAAAASANPATILCQK
jgi:hypothetical protein